MSGLLELSSWTHSSHMAITANGDGNVMDRCHVDITGLYPKSARGSKYILTCIDSFSKCTEAFAIPNKDAKTVP